MTTGDGKIDKLRSLVELIRTDSKLRGPSVSAQTHSNSQKDKSASVSHHVPNIEELRSRLVDQFNNYEPSGKKHLSNMDASRLIVKEVLLWEFGPKIGQHAEFDLILTKISKAIEANTRLQVKITSLVEELKKD